MNINLLSQSVFVSIAITVLIFSLINVSSAQVRSSASYQLQSDSINLGGGLSNSASYYQESTVGEVSTGLSESGVYSLRAGYQQMQEIFISLSNTGDVIMSPDLPGLTGGVSNGSTTFTVTTDSPSGYQLTIESENSPSMQRDGGGASIPDYDAGAEPDFSFLVSSNDAYLGFSPKGNDVVQSFIDDGGNCNTGSQQTAFACWDGLDISPVVIAEGVGSNHPEGATTTVYFRVGLGSSAGVEKGVYTATTTVTALPL